ncbi:MAG: response regulator [Deltaproteobacteria bacterium]|nr:response regulator [Deltaproteobacteria bacterium]
MSDSAVRTQEKERLFDLLIHDLRSPLAIASTSVHNLLQRAERYGPVNDRQRPVLERIARNIQKSQNLLQEMIEILRSEEGFYRREYFYLEQVVGETLLEVLEMLSPQTVERLAGVKNLEEYREILEQEGISIEISGKFCGSLFCHDRCKISQILRNLISNALKYRRRRVEVILAGETNLLIKVRDDGPGISREGQKILFGRFVRIEENNPFQWTGLGLGLAGIKTLVETMGGKIELESREGAGTTFMVELPPLSRRKENGLMKDSILNGKKILAVDDEPDVLDILEEEIGSACEGCRIYKATTYEQAVELLNQKAFDLVILDIMGVRGFELLEEALKQDLPVAMLTAHALSPEALKKSIEMGARAYLPKEKLGDVVPFLEDILKYGNEEGWGRLFGRMGDFFDRRFGPDWRKSESQFWKGFSDQIEGRFDRVVIK